MLLLKRLKVIRQVQPSGIRRQRAILCINCEMIVDIETLTGCGRCPHCGSLSLSPIVNWMDRPDLAAARVENKQA